MEKHREDDFIDWLDKHQVIAPSSVAPAFGQAKMRISELDELASVSWKQF